MCYFLMSSRSATTMVQIRLRLGGMKGSRGKGLDKKKREPGILLRGNGKKNPTFLEWRSDGDPLECWRAGISILRQKAGRKILWQRQWNHRLPPPTNPEGAEKKFGK